MIAVPQNSLNLSVVIATGGLLTTSVISCANDEDVSELLKVRMSEVYSVVCYKSTFFVKCSTMGPSDTN